MPVNPPGSQPIRVSPQPVEGSKPLEERELGIEEHVDEAAQEALSHPPEAKEKNVGGFWSWLGWGSEAVEEEELEEPTEEDFEEMLEEEGAGTLLGEGTEEFAKEPGLSPELTLEEKQPLSDDQLAGLAELQIPGKKTDTAAAEKKEQFEAAVEKTEEVRKGWWQATKGAIGKYTGFHAVTEYVHQAKEYVQKVSEYPETLKSHKQGMIDESKQTMLEHIEDPQFVELYDLLNGFLTHFAATEIGKLESGFVNSKLKSFQGLIIDLLEVNLAKGFANLARQTDESRDQIPNYDNQPSLVSILSLISQKGSAHLNMEHLKKIEEKYRGDKARLAVLTKELFPEIASDPQKQEIIRKLTSQGNIYVGDRIDHFTFPEILTLFPNYNDPESDPETAEFIKTCHALVPRDQELELVFSQLADDILKHLFPKKFEDMEIPDFLKQNIPGFGTNIAEIAYNRLAKGALVNFLKESYEPLEDDATRHEEWKNDLQERLGVSDLKPVMEAPSTFALAFVKDFIQSNPKAVTFAELGLNFLAKPTGVPAGDPLLVERNGMFANLSQAQLANWFVESTQVMLHTEDPHLLGLGRFVGQAMNKLTLALLAKGAKLVIPEGEEVQENQFIKELTDRMIEKFSALKKGETISDQTWKDFVNDLPLPPALKGILVPLVIEKSKDLQVYLKEKAEQIGEVEQLYTETEKKVRDFKKGEELLSIAEKISEQVIERLNEKKFELVSAVGFGDTLEELLTQYLPGVQIDDHLKEWFKENISAFGPSESGIQTQSIELLKRGIQAVILKAIVNTIETNFKDDSENYAAALLHNIHQAFIKAISGFDEAQRVELEEAFAIQAKIQKKKEQIEALRKEMAEKPEGLTDRQQLLLEETLQANMRFTRASDYIESLQLKLDETLLAVNKGFIEEEEWSEDQLPLVGQALVLHRMKASAFPSLAAYKNALKTEILTFKGAEASADLQEAQAARDAIDTHEILLDLLEMTKDEVKLIEEAVNIQVTIKHAEQEKSKLSEELQAAKEAVEGHTLEKLNNRPLWKKAVAWMEKALPNREQLHQLSKEAADLHKELDTHLKMFQVLSGELTALLGLDQKDKLKLPPFLLDHVWPLIESAKKEQIARLLFEQLTPMILIIADVQKNKDRLAELSKDDPFLAQLAESASAEVVGRLSDFVTNYHPFAKQILVILGVDDPTDEEIARMEGSLRLTMIEVGGEGVTAAMLQALLKDNVPEEKVEAISQALEDWIKAEDEEELSQHSMFEFLMKEMPFSNDKEKEKLIRTAKLLAHEVNTFLVNRGKGLLTPEDLLDAYQEQVEGRQQKIATNDVPGALHDLASEKVIDKIKTVVITHDEIAHALEKFIPGAEALHTLIAPQLEQVIIGEDKALQANRKFVQEYIEGMLLQLFVKIGEANLEKGESILTVLARKLENILPDTEDLQGRTAEEVAQDMINRVLADVLGIVSSSDLDGIPIALRAIGFEKLKEQAYQQLTPLLLPMIEVKQSREKLRNLSGSKFLGKISQALAKDLFSLLPLAVNSYRAIGIDLFELLSEREPTAEEADQFAQEIAKLVKLNKEGVVTNEHLADAYVKVAQVVLTAEEKQELIEQLDERKAINEILNIVITPEEITEKIRVSMPKADPALMEAFTNELQGVVHNNPDAYQHFSGFGEAYLEAILLNVFIRIAEKNPRQDEAGKDTLIVLVEKLLENSAAKFEETKGEAPEVIAQQFNDMIMQDLLGIDSPEVFTGLPDPLKETAYREIKDLLGGFLLQIQQGLTTLESTDEGVAEAQENVKKFGVGDVAAKGFAQILADDLANMIVTTVPNVLTEMGAHQMKGVNVISKGIGSYLEELAQGNLATASVLLKYSKGEEFQEMLGGVLEKLGDSEKHLEEKKKAADLIANLILVPLNKVLEQTAGFEKEQGEAFNQKLMAKLLGVAAGHFKNLNAAKKLAAAEGRTDILHKDFIVAAGEGLHPAVPREAVTFEETIQAIRGKIYDKLDPKLKKKWDAEEDNLRLALTLLAKKDSSGEIVMTVDDVVNEVNGTYHKATGKYLMPLESNALKDLPLSNLVRKEAEAPAVQRKKEAFEPAIKEIMQMIFPNGKKDLTFVKPVELRGQVWKLFEEKLFPVVLPMITELLLDPDVINSMILSSLETMKETLDQPIVLEKGEPADRPLDALDEASGELITEMLSTVKLPEWIKKQMIDPKTGEISPAMKKALGATLRKQLNKTFFKEKLEMALEKMVERKGEDYLLKPDTASKEEKTAKAEARRETVQKDMKKVTEDLVIVSINYFIRSKWAEAQARFDELIARAFGKIGLKLKQALDAVFGFIFFKIVGTILSLLFYPIKGFVRQKLYDYISLDENREILLNLLTKAPVDQPLTEGHVVWNEALVYNLAQAVKETVVDVLNEPVLPVKREAEKSEPEVDQIKDPGGFDDLGFGPPIEVQ